MFQHADVGKCPAAPVVVPVSLVLPLQSPGAAACQGHAAAGTGADGTLVFKHTDLQLRTHKSRVNTQIEFQGLVSKQPQSIVSWHIGAPLDSRIDFWVGIRHRARAQKPPTCKRKQTQFKKNIQCFATSWGNYTTLIIKDILHKDMSLFSDATFKDTRAVMFA